MEIWNDESRMGQPSAVYQVAESKERENPESPLLEKGDEIIDMGEDFDFEGFQVVRREFFAHLTEPRCHLQQLPVLCEQRMSEQVP